MNRTAKRTMRLAVIATLVLLVGGTMFAPRFGQRHAIETIKRLGGKVTVTHRGPAWFVRLAGGRSLGLFDRATVVNLSGAPLRNDELTLLHRLSGVERLNLSDTPISDQGLMHVAQLHGLKALDLSRTPITGDGLVHLSRLTSLEYLYLNGVDVADEHLEHLSGLTKLKHLGVEYTDVTPWGLSQYERQLHDADE